LTCSGNFRDPLNRVVALEPLAIDRRFEVIIDSGGTSHPKPLPEVYELAIRGLGLATNIVLDNRRLAQQH